MIDSELGFIDKYGHVYNSGTMDLSWSRITLNRGILATRGSSQTLRFETTIPGSDLQYYKLFYDAQMFQPLTKDLTLRLKTSLGYGGGYGDVDELPFFENFYSGGFGSVRGFEKSALGPRGTFSAEYDKTSIGWNDLNNDGVQNFGESLGGAYILCDDATPILSGNSLVSCDPGKLMSSPEFYVDGRANAIGGNVLMEFGAELILPIPFVEDSRSMQLVAFVDAGNAFSTYCRDTQLNCYSPSLSRLASSYGLGFTWISGMGPMTFSYAFPLNSSEFDQTEQFQFTFGGGF